MRKFLILAVAVSLALFALGCSQAKVISGDCSEVVKACQDVSGEAEVTVKGIVTIEGSTKDEAYVLSQTGVGFPYVYVTFKSIDDAAKVSKGDTVKVRGKLNAPGTLENAIFLNDVVLVG